MKQPRQVTIVATIAATFTYDQYDNDLSDDTLATEFSQTLVSLTSDMKANMVLEEPDALVLNEVSVDVMQVIPSAFDYE
jgi:hypothetical protein